MSGERGSCTVHSCGEKVSRPGHTLCYEHWKAKKDGNVQECAECGSVYQGTNDDCPKCRAGHEPPASRTTAGKLTATKLGKELGLSSQKTNLVLAELGWIEKAAKGWRPTKHGTKLGAAQKRARQTGVPYVVWPGSIAGNRALRSSVAELLGTASVETAEHQPTEGTTDAASAAVEIAEFRKKFPAKHRARDGHMVRSRAEMLVDNFLYVSGLVHAYERRLPIEEDVYSDFYLPDGKVYIEYWGLENQPKYRARMEEKKATYAKYGFNLISLTDEHISVLDDVLPRLLLQFEISTG